MPLPERQNGEERDRFIQRCMIDGEALKEFPDNNQRFAVCQNLADKDTGESHEK